MKAQTNPRIIQAILFSCEQDIIAFTEVEYKFKDNQAFIKSFGNWKEANVGEDMLIFDGGCVYPCKVDIFNQTYTKIKDTSYRKNKYTIDFIIANDNSQIEQFVGKDRFEIKEDEVFILTLEGWVKVLKTDRIILSVKGEVYPVDQETFSKIYTVVHHD